MQNHNPFLLFILANLPGEQEKGFNIPTIKNSSETDVKNTNFVWFLAQSPIWGFKIHLKAYEQL